LVFAKAVRKIAHFPILTHTAYRKEFVTILLDRSRVCPDRMR